MGELNRLATEEAKTSSRSMKSGAISVSEDVEQLSSSYVAYTGEENRAGKRRPHTKQTISFWWLVELNIII